jgi:hypothetical protein
MQNTKAFESGGFGNGPHTKVKVTTLKMLFKTTGKVVIKTNRNILLYL